MKRLIITLFLFSSSFCHAEAVSFQEISMRACSFFPPGTKASNYRIASQSEYDDFIFEYLHDYLTQFLVNWAKNENRAVPMVPPDYRQQLKQLRVAKPGLPETEYIQLISAELASPWLTDKVNPVSHLKDCTFPALDFLQENLIVMSGMTGGCKPPRVEHQIERNAELKQFRAELIVQQQGMCMAGHWIASWLKIPAVPEGYAVTYNRKDKPVSGVQ